MIFFAAAVVIVVVVSFSSKLLFVCCCCCCLFVYLFARVLSSVYPIPITFSILPCTVTKATLMNIAYFN